MMSATMPASASQWLTGLGPPDRVTLVPGNHDVYVATKWGQGLGRWGAYIAGDGEPPSTGLFRRAGRRRAGGRRRLVDLVG